MNHNYFLQIISLAAMLTFSLCAGAQNEESKSSKTTNAKQVKVFDVVEQMPQFNGGQEALMLYLSNNIKYPESAETSGIQGRVISTFVVECDGSISNVEVVKSIDPSLDKEAIRVISTMPNWIPGKQNGSAVRVKYTLPITFRLDTPKQNTNPAVPTVSTTAENNTATPAEKTQVAEEMPEFKGGQAALMAYLSKNVRYPAEALKNGIQGRVVTKFVVEVDGSITNVEVARSINPYLDKEAIRVVKSMPKWNPGKSNGKPVRTRFVLPVSFRLN